MDVDPTRNTVVFEFQVGNETDTATTDVPTRAVDGVALAWQAATAERALDANQVTQIFVEWEPTRLDAAFMDDRFPQATITFGFDRPDSEDGWEAAYAAARETMEKEMAEEALAEAAARREAGEVTLMPLLRDYAEDDAFTQTIVHRRFGPVMGVFLAQVAPTDSGTIGIDYLMARDVEPERTDEAFATALANLSGGLQIEGGDAGGVRVIRIVHPAGFAASAITLPGFQANAATWLENESVFVAFPTPDVLFVTLPETPIADQLRQAVLTSDYWGSVALTPTCLVMTPEGNRIVATRETN